MQLPGLTASSTSTEAALKRLECRVRPGSVAWAIFLGTTALHISAYFLLHRFRTATGLEWANHDVANTLYVGRELLTGKQLYVDILELNPPGIFLLASGIYAIAEWLRASPILAYHCAVLLLATLGSWWLQRICMRLAHASTMVLIGLAFAIISLGSGMPGGLGLTGSFGQREHLFVLVFIPYLWRRLNSDQRLVGGDLLMFLVGATSGMKPHFLLLVSAVELIGFSRAWRQQRRSWLLIGAGAALQFVVLLTHSRDSFAAFWKVTISYHTSGLYSAFNQPYAVYWNSELHHWLVVHALVFAYLAWPLLNRRVLPLPVRMYAVVLPLLGYGAVLQQRKFWDYHSIPVASILLFLGAFALAKLLPRLPRQRARATFCLATICLLLELRAALVARTDLLSNWARGTGQYSALVALAPFLDGKTDVLYYSTSIEHTRLALSLGHRIVGKHCHDFEYPALIRGANSESIDRYCDAQRALIRATLPSAIVFRETRQGLRLQDPDLHHTLVERCHVVPFESYENVPLFGMPGQWLYVRQ